MNIERKRSIEFTGDCICHNIYEVDNNVYNQYLYIWVKDSFIITS